MALRAIAFGAMGTAGQRCTTLRRLFVHESVYDQLVPRLQEGLPEFRHHRQSAGIQGTLVGPLIDKAVFRPACKRPLLREAAKYGRRQGDRRTSVSKTDQCRMPIYVKPGAGRNAGA